MSNNKRKLPAFLYVVAAVILFAAWSSGNKTAHDNSTAPSITSVNAAHAVSPTSPEPGFHVGDVVDVDEAGYFVDSPVWPGGLECWTRSRARENLTRAILVLQKTRMWSGSGIQDCSHLDHTYAYEVMEIADAPAPYDHMYCVNSVSAEAKNKNGCVWAVFPHGHARLSACKAGPAMSDEEIAKWAKWHKNHENDPVVLDVRTPPSHILSCQNFKTRVDG